MKVLLLFVACLPFIACQPLIGGQQPIKIDLTDPVAVFAVQGIKETLRASGDEKPRVAQEVVSATSQVVSGILYRLVIKLSDGEQKEICNVTVWSRPWLEGEEKIKLQGTPKCEPEKPAPAPLAGGLVGGQEEVDFNTDAGAQNCVTFLEETINAKSNSLYYIKKLSVGKVTKQVVNGVIYRYADLTFGPSTCTKVEVQRNVNQLCVVPPNAQPQQKCIAEVLYNLRQDPNNQYIVNKLDCTSG